MLYRLIVLTGPLANQRITVSREPMTLGSDSGCQLVLPDEEVAPKHALLEDRGEGGLHIRDLGTMHKILVNSREVRQSRLKHGDMVEIGRTRFLVQAVVAAVVSGTEAAAKERFSPKLYIAAAAVLVLGVITWWRWPQNHPQLGPPKAEPELNVAAAEPATNSAVETPEVVEASPTPRRMTASDFSNALASVVFPATSENGQTNPVTTEIQKMRAELDAMHERIKSVTPATVAVPEPPKLETSAPPAVVIAPPLPPVIIVTAAPSPVATASNSAPVSYVAHNTQPPTNLPERPQAIAVTNITPEVATMPVIDAPTGRVLRVLNVEQSRFPASDDYDDMRSFNIILSLTNPRYEIANPDVSVDLTFYDEDVSTGVVKPSASVAPLMAMRPTQSWGNDRRCTISTTYLLPKGSREKEKAAGHESRYYGFAVRVTYQGRLQDEWALPRSLLINISSAQPTNGIKSAQANLAP